VTGGQVVLDNEAVQALLDPTHPKHRRVLAVVEAVVARAQRRPGTVRLNVPTTVRVEAGWDRRDPDAAPINRLRITDHPLDATRADKAAALHTRLGISVTDAHLGAVLTDLPGTHAVVTSDVRDLKRIAAHLGTPTNIIRL
jgi:hypothetical protein